MVAVAVGERQNADGASSDEAVGLNPAILDPPLNSTVSSATRTMHPGFKEFLAKPATAPRNLGRKKRAALFGIAGLGTALATLGSGLIVGGSSLGSAAITGAATRDAAIIGRSNTDSNNYPVYNYGYGNSYDNNYGGYGSNSGISDGNETLFTHLLMIGGQGHCLKENVRSRCQKGPGPIYINHSR